MIVRYFAFGEESDEELAVLAGASVHLMIGVIKPLGRLLATLPVGPERPGATAGANFQLAYRANFLLPHRRAAWIRFSERLEEAADFSDTIALPLEGRAVLEGVTRVLRAVRADLEGHIEPG